MVLDHLGVVYQSSNFKFRTFSLPLKELETHKHSLPSSLPSCSMYPQFIFYCQTTFHCMDIAHLFTEDIAMQHSFEALCGTN